MLVLTRKTDEQILIGDNIKITLVRVRGNSVRIGIEAPREVRVVRGELVKNASKASGEIELELNDREQVFAHPQAKIYSGHVTIKETPNDETMATAAAPAIEQVTAPPAMVGPVRRRGDQADRLRAPLARFVSAT